MCGLSGFLAKSAPPEDFEVVLGRMGKSLAHRGPDDSGIWFDAQNGIGISHRRLAVVDISVAGHQPMQSASSRYVLAYNGEIYNHLEIRAELEMSGLAPAWEGHSDTETLLAATDAWGIRETLVRCVGMFAIALWCKKTRTLTLARDRLGEKPLYYGWQGNARQRTFLFGSELKALKAHPAFEGAVDRNSLALFLRHNYIPAPHSIYSSINKLMPGHMLTLTNKSEEVVSESYWSAAEVIARGMNRPLVLAAAEVVDGLDRVLTQAVRQQMISDVPLGAFLSGGVDSSAVVALMQEQSARPVKTFTIGFSEATHNEAPFAKAVAEHLGTDHTELYVTSRNALEVIPQLPVLYDEPFADSSQIPTYLVSRLAREHVTVSLSGDGGDELFSGYNRYALTENLWSKLSVVPEWLRALGARGILAVSPQVWSQVLAPIGPMLPGSLRQTNIGDKLHKGAGALRSADIDELYQKLISLWRNPSDVVRQTVEPDTNLGVLPRELEGLSGVERMMARDLLTYLPDDILAKVDRASMGVSLESRVPFLDHRVVEYAWTIPQAVKSRGGQTKWPLREVLYRRVPKALIERPKSGFSVPLDQWLRGPLRDWANDLLNEQRLHDEGYFDPQPIRSKWLEHLSGKRNWGAHLWTVLMFQSWLHT